MRSTKYISMIPFDRTAHGWKMLFRPIPCVGDLLHRFKQVAASVRDGRACRLLAPLSHQRLSSGMGCTGAPIIDVLRDAGPFDGFCLTSAACPECVKSHGTEPQARIASCALRRPTLLSSPLILAIFCKSSGSLAIFTAIRRASPRKRTSRRLPQRETMVKYCDDIALDRRRHIGGGQGIPSIESLQALAGSQSCACGPSIQMRQQTS